ncbi:MAG: UDP-N-acetylglucosamine 2-epimerase (non-hydrolyzing) [Candidatus Peribacteraceae bacterium]
MLTVLSSVSARPNFVKLASVHHALAQRSGEFKHVIVHTGQHYDPLLSGVFFKQLGIPEPDFNLGVKGGNDREAVIQATATAMMPVMEKVKPDVVLVYGDVNGAVGAARAAKELGIKIGHVEAGLRSGDLEMPEENNRIEIDQLADLLFVTEKSGEDHLKEEEVKGKIFFVGNTMIDTLMRMMPIVEKMPLPFTAMQQPFAIATIHRPSNVDDPDQLEKVMGCLNKIPKQNISLVLPAHPRLRQSIGAYSRSKGLVLVGFGIFMIDPLGYLEFVRMMKDAAFIVTDSGGIQEEAVFLGKRCFTLRRNTERPSTVDSGSNVLIDPEKASDRKLVLEFAEHPVKIVVSIPPKWDGKTGERIAEALQLYSGGAR